MKVKISIIFMSREEKSLTLYELKKVFINKFLYMQINRTAIENYIDAQPIKAVTMLDIDNMQIRYNSDIKSARTIEDITGEEELVRAILLTKLANEYKYPLSSLEIEKTYSIGRPKVINPRIDVMVKDEDGNVFMFIELKAPDKFTEDQDQVIEKQLFNLAGSEIALGHSIKYLVLLSCDLLDGSFKNNAILIDYERYNSFESWKDERDYADEVPVGYGKALKKPYIKGGDKDLETHYSKKNIDNMRVNLHNVLWGGGGTDDNEVFSSLVNIILAKIQDESEKEDGEKYDFQSFSYADGESGTLETNETLFERINTLYRRALKERMYILDDKKINKSYVVNEEKFSLSKLKYAVTTLERYSLVDGKNSYDGKDILGDFFEGIIRDGFKQSKGQFFTHVNIVTFMLWALQVDKLAIERINRDKEIPYLIDPSAGSATFLIEYMKFITSNIKYRFKDKLARSRDVNSKYEQWFKPDNHENQWAKDYIYGVEHNFNLGTASKVNMILHGDGSTNIFVTDGLLPFNTYNKETAPNALKHAEDDENYTSPDGTPKQVNKQFDIVLSNPPFSVDLDNDTKLSLENSFQFGDKRNSENLFIERYYQLLREKGRMGIVLPESVFDTAENKYIRIFIYRYFNVKAIVSLPQVAFQPYTPTKTSLLFAQKKTKSEVAKWDEEWKKQSKEWGKLKTRCKNLISVYCDGVDRSNFPSIARISPSEEHELLLRLLRDLITPSDISMNSKMIVEHYYSQLLECCKEDSDTAKIFGHVNTWWVFGEVTKTIGNSILIAEAEYIGYKRTKRGEYNQPNDLFRVDEKGRVLVDDGIIETILDEMRAIDWR